MSKETHAAVAETRKAFRAQHVATYLGSGGRDGHFIDLRDIGGFMLTPSLLIETFGRKSGNRQLMPLAYGIIGGEAVIVAAKAGADQHPGWYLNLTARPGITFQIGGQAYRGEWREPEGAERDRVWDYMAAVCPQYATYQASTPRRIPVVMLKPVEPVAPFEA